MECLFLLCLRAHKYTPAPVDACAEEFLMRNFMRAEPFACCAVVCFSAGEKNDAHTSNGIFRVTIIERPHIQCLFSVIVFTQMKI
jgi:hypothetical protein